MIRIRKDSVPQSRGSQTRKEAVIEQQAFKPMSLSRIHRFGKRGTVEGTYTCIKRIFGEYVSAKKFVNVAREMAMKATHLQSVHRNDVRVTDIQPMSIPGNGVMQQSTKRENAALSDFRDKSLITALLHNSPDSSVTLRSTLPLQFAYISLLFSEIAFAHSPGSGVSNSIAGQSLSLANCQIRCSRAWNVA